MLTRKPTTIVLIIALLAPSLWARPKTKSVSPHEKTRLSDRAEILKMSSLSYRAEGGFTGVQSYHVMISCIDGTVSTLASIYDPKIGSSPAMQKSGEMSADAYVALWERAHRMAILTKRSATAPDYDILDEFTVSFEARLGKKNHEFSAVACSRPEASQYFAIKQLLDHAVDMAHLWSVHEALVRK